MRSPADAFEKEGVSLATVASDWSESTVAARDPLYLFACHLEWRRTRNVRAYEELVAALDDPVEGVRTVAAHLLSNRPSPYPKRLAQASEDETW
jgi:hypothetical protein